MKQKKNINVKKYINLGENKVLFIPLDNDNKIPIEKLFTFKQGENELKINKNGNKISVDYFFKKSKINGRILEIKVDENQIFKYDINSIDKDKIKNDIKKSSTKSDNKKTITFGQSSSISDRNLYTKLEDFNKDNIELAKNINNVKINNKIKCDDIIKNINSLSEKSNKISKLLKCNCSDGS